MASSKPNKQKKTRRLQEEEDLDRSPKERKGVFRRLICSILKYLLRYLICGSTSQISLTPYLFCFLGFIIIAVLVAIVTGVIVWVRHFENETKSKSDVNSYSSIHGDMRDLKISKSKAAVSENITDYMSENEKLCDKISDKDAPESNDSPTHIYIVKGNQNLSNGQACGVESILRIFPDKTVYVIDFNKHVRKDFDRCDPHPNYLALLQSLYKDRLQLVFADPAVYFKKTPLQEISKSGGNLEFFAMLLTAYKYGGFVVTPAVVVTSRELIECFPEETIIEPFVILTSKKCDKFLYYLMENFKSCNRNFTSCFDETLTKAAELYSRDQAVKRFTARRLCPAEVSSNVNSPCIFLKMQEFKNSHTKWISDISIFCKQVVQAYLGISINQMEVEEETKKMKTRIKENAGKIICGMSPKEEEECFP